MRPIIFILLFLFTSVSHGKTEKIASSPGCRSGMKIEVGGSQKMAEVHKICNSLSETEKYLRRLGMSIPHRIEVNILARSNWPSILPVDAPAIAITAAKTGVVYIQSFEKTKDMYTDLFGPAMNFEAYLSYISHEVVHAVSIHHHSKQTGGEQIPHEQSEFLAYFVQISLLSPKLRNNVIERFLAKRWQTFQSDEEINNLYHMINPFGFAVKSYKYMETSMGGQYLARLIDGSIPENSGDDQG